jgi:cytochrome c-type biogenesis protein CcmH
MSHWLVFAALALAAAAALALPLARRGGRRGAARAEYDLEVYRRQLAELETDRARGQIGTEQAQTARAEIERRVLALGGAGGDEEASGTTPRGRWLAVAAVAVGVPVLSFAVYALVGTPGAPDRPLVERDLSTRTAMAENMETAIGKLAARLEEDSDDLDGWLLLARTLVFVDRYDEAVTAFARAEALAPEDNDIAAAYGETLVHAAGGVVTPAAKRAFEAVLARDPAHPGARFYRGMARAQAGDPEGAFETWRALAEDADPAEPWLPALREQLRALAAKLDIEPPAVALAEAPGPGPEDLEAAAQMTPDEQNAMIESMVARLEGRLIDNPDDPEGWKRLGRAKRVLGDLAGAREAYGRAAEGAPDDLAALAALAEVLVEERGSDGPLPAPAVTVYERMLEVDSGNPDALWFLGLDAARAGRTGKAIGFWSRLADLLPQGSDEHRELSQRIAELAGGG